MSLDAHPRIGRDRVQAMGWSRYGHHEVLCSGNQRMRLVEGNQRRRLVGRNQCR